ncbi:probable cytochrome P450 313a4 [Sitodiplosis mosellana]|uniref:probable cytochrome P450 313a4 n=1 Tax=Sitodiplosis mosellana TaxID=263140 RepID=UPI002443E706|nr:probable cytochrome P450 313a4 [Sitodiplosis mosellana]
MIHGIISVLIVAFVFILYGELRKWFIKRKLRNFESPKEMPILGVTPHFLGKSDDEFCNVLANFFYEVKTTPLQIWLGPVLMIGVSEPEDIRIILTSNDCLNRPHIYKFMISPTTIIATDKEIWKPHRRALNAAFNPKVLQSFVPFLNEKSRILITKMEPFFKENGDMYRTIFIGHMDTVSRTLIGLDMNAQYEETGATFSEVLRVAMSTIQCRIARFWYHLDWIFKWSKTGRVQQDCVNKGNVMLESLYERKVDEIREKGIDYLDKIKEENTASPIEKCLMLEQSGIFDHQTVLDHLRLFFIGGVDTSSITVFGTLLMLAMNQNHQELVVEELRSVFESADCDVTHDHLARMPYLERVIKESMRLIPPIPFIARKPSADIEVARGTIPKGANVIINIMHLHRNPKIWGENATEFDPDRFLPDNIAKRPPFTYIPFSGGPRNCIGMKYAMMSAKIVLANLLRRYKFTTKLKFQDLHFKMHIILEISNENALQLEERNFANH